MELDRRTLTCILALTLAGCAKAPTDDPHDAATAEPPMVEMHIVAQEGEEAALEVRDHAGGTLRLLPARPFLVAEAGPAVDTYGYPAVAVEIAASEHVAFHDWSAAHVNRLLAIVLDGEALMVATINEPLVGRFQITGGSAGLDEQRVAELVAAYSGDSR